MVEDDKPQGRLTKLTEKLLAGPRATPEEIAESVANRAALLGTSREWAEMQPDFSIAQDIVQWMPDGSKGHGWSVSEPGNADYEDLCRAHKLEKPGDASTIVKRLINGKWVAQDSLE